MTLYYQNFLRNEFDQKSIDLAIRKGWKIQPEMPIHDLNEVVRWDWQSECWVVESLPKHEENFYTELYQGFLVEPENFRIAMQDSDRNQWTALRSQILDGLSMEKLSMDTPLIIWDIEGNPKEVAVRRLREILFDSGVWYIRLKAKYANL